MAKDVWNTLVALHVSHNEAHVAYLHKKLEKEVWMKVSLLTIFLLESKTGMSS